MSCESFDVSAHTAQTMDASKKRLSIPDCVATTPSACGHAWRRLVAHVGKHPRCLNGAELLTILQVLRNIQGESTRRNAQYQLECLYYEQAQGKANILAKQSSAGVGGSPDL